MADKIKTHSKNSSQDKPAAKTAASKEAAKQKKAEQKPSGNQNTYITSGIDKQNLKTPEDKLGDYSFMKGPIPTTDKSTISVQHFEFTTEEKKRMTDKQIRDFEAIQKAYEQGWKNEGLTGLCVNPLIVPYAAVVNLKVTTSGLFKWMKKNIPKIHNINDVKNIKENPLDSADANHGCTGCWNAQFLTAKFVKSALPKETDWEMAIYDMPMHHTMIIKIKGKPANEGYVFDPWFTQSPEIYRYMEYRITYPLTTLGSSPE